MPLYNFTYIFFVFSGMYLLWVNQLYLLIAMHFLVEVSFHQGWHAEREYVEKICSPNFNCGYVPLSLGFLFRMEIRSRHFQLAWQQRRLRRCRKTNYGSSVTADSHAPNSILPAATTNRHFHTCHLFTSVNYTPNLYNCLHSFTGFLKCLV